jgi:hypothetical protein
VDDDDADDDDDDNDDDDDKPNMMISPNSGTNRFKQGTLIPF